MHKFNFPMKSLTFSCSMRALNVYFAQKLLKKAKLAKFARTAEGCFKHENCSKDAELSWREGESRHVPFLVYA